MIKRVLSGNRPTGRLHIGHYYGALSNWIRLQEEYDCFFFIADWHALTTKYDETDNLKSDTFDMVVDWLAMGLDPKKATIYRQSDLPQVAELALYLSMITPISWLERCPTYKEMAEEISHKEIATHGFLGYPVLQTADIIICHGQIVPVGEDQLPHLELAREIVRRFNHLYGDSFVEPQALLTEAKRVLGTDGRKMSKSYGNDIKLSDEPEIIRAKVMGMITDPARIRKDDPGHPEVCLVFSLHKVYSDDIAEIEEECRAGERGCVECKRMLSERIADSLKDFREARREIEKDSSYIYSVLKSGAEKVTPIAEETLAGARRAIKID